MRIHKVFHIEYKYVLLFIGRFMIIQLWFGIHFIAILPFTIKRKESKTSEPIKWDASKYKLVSLEFRTSGTVLFFGRYQQHNREDAIYTTTKPMITTHPFHDSFDYMNAVVFILMQGQIITENTFARITFIQSLSWQVAFILV